MGCSQSTSKPVQRPDASNAAAPVQQSAAPAAAAAAVTTGAAAPAATVSESGSTVPASANAPVANGTAAVPAAAAVAAPAVRRSPEPIQVRNVAIVEQHRPLVVAGPSGVGKGTLLTRLLKEYPHAFAKSVSHTTRAPRSGEVDGVSYHFTTADKLLTEVADNKFVEHANVHGNYYGTSIASVAQVMQSGRLCLLEIDIQGVLQVRKVASLNPRCIFIRPPTFGHLAERLAARGSESAETTQKRLDTARDEMDFFYTNRRVFDADIINDELEAAYKQLCNTIKQLYPHLDFTQKATTA